MTTIYHHTHPHHKVFKEFIEGCFANPDNPPVVQIRPGVAVWFDTKQPDWDALVSHRIKPRTITRTVTYPEPMREEPKNGTSVWFVSCCEQEPNATYWEGFECDFQALKNGMCFATEADAQACYDALFGSES